MLCCPARHNILGPKSAFTFKTRYIGRRIVNRLGSHSPPFAASSARVSEPDVRLTVSSPNTLSLGAGSLYQRPGKARAQHEISRGDSDACYQRFCWLVLHVSHAKQIVTLVALQRILDTARRVCKEYE